MTKEEQLKIIETIAPLKKGKHGTRGVRQDFFESISTELQAYILGFFASDGNINEKRKTFRLHLQLRDCAIVDLIKDTICPDARTFYKEPCTFMGPRGKIINGHGSYGVDINSSKLCTDLVDLGFGYNKSYADLQLPKIPQELMPHFIRGYFDGDGGISGSYVPADPKWHKKERFRAYAMICAKSRSILKEILEE